MMTWNDTKQPTRAHKHPTRGQNECVNDLSESVPYPAVRRPLHTMALSTIMRNNKFTIMRHVWRPQPLRVHLILTFCIQLRGPLHTDNDTIGSFAHPPF